MAPGRGHARGGRSPRLRLGRPAVTVRRWCRQGALPAERMGRDWLITEEALAAFTPPEKAGWPKGRPRAPQRLTAPRPPGDEQPDPSNEQPCGEVP